MTHHWPSIRVKRFCDETAEAYDQRRAEIVAIMVGFRKGRFGSDLAERLDQRLDDLLTGLADGTRPDPFGLLATEPAPTPVQFRQRVPLRVVHDVYERSSA